MKIHPILEAKSNPPQIDLDQFKSNFEDFLQRQNQNLRLISLGAMATSDPDAKTMYMAVFGTAEPSTAT